MLRGLPTTKSRFRDCLSRVMTIGLLALLSGGVLGGCTNGNLSSDAAGDTGAVSDTGSETTGGWTDVSDPVDTGEPSVRDTAVQPDSEPASDADAEPFGCQPAANPSVADASFDMPDNPEVGGSADVRITASQAFTNIHLVARHADGESEAQFISVNQPPAPFTWTFRLRDLSAGDYCLSFISDDHDPKLLATGKFTVPPESENGGNGESTSAYKLVEHHQDTCSENGFGIGVKIRVLDENGNPMGGVPLKLTWDSTPHVSSDNKFWKPSHLPPEQLTTGADGWASFQNKWPIYHPKSNPDDTKFHVFNIAVDGAPSDTATEVTSGYGEDIESSGGGRCNFCPGSNSNVWGHWSYRIVFQKKSGVTETCVQNHDHAGQQRCAPDMYWVEPKEPRCSPTK